MLPFADVCALYAGRLNCTAPVLPRDHAALPPRRGGGH
eukprot:gene32507-14392_t